ncbi:MAG: Fis family transcriptional regulator [Sorangiineae bacterium NIC37A_2]|jgi:two-component system response regulator PilR (NtrC family)|nr:MAG: Fis family transcriptional regulator [Sorangiineae bacterium NIC37A_2]
MTLRPSEPRVLVVDDEPTLRQTLTILLRRAGFEPTVCAGYFEALGAIRDAPRPYPVVLTDLAMPGGSGLDVLAAAKARSPHTQVVFMTAHSSVESAVDAMRGGAYDFVKKPFDTGELVVVLTKALEKFALTTENAALRARVQHDEAAPILGRSPVMRKVMDLVQRVARSRTSVLITGESGTGKERIAQAVHRASDRADRPFLVINCGALPENLMESELFGHEKGAFTGASERTLGLFREAEGGTVFLDEIGELPLPLQVKLLRVLQERKVRPVGSAKEVPVDVRVIAATNRPIEADVEAEKFRSDLYYRINVVRIELPPLRERREDIFDLVDSFRERFALELGKDVRGVTPDALRALLAYDFPGNVRELENMMERAVTLAGSTQLGLGDFPETIGGWASAPGPALLELPEGGCDLDAVLMEVERRLLTEALERAGGIRTHAAKLLGVSFRSFRYRLSKHSLDPDGGSLEEGDADDEA